MSLHFIYGNSGAGKSNYIYNLVADKSDADPHGQYYVIVPEQYAFKTENELMNRLNRHVLINIDVVSFQRLAFRIFDEVGVHTPVMEETGKSLILRKIAADKASELSVIGNNIKKMGYIGEVKSVISEFMQYGITLEDVSALIDSSDEKSLLKMKLEDIKVIYQGFEDYLEGHYVVAEKLLDILIDIADRSQLLKGSTIVLDGYTGFTPVQLKLLRKLMNIAEDIYVTVTMDEQIPFGQKIADHELFNMSYKTIEKLTLMADEEKCEVEKPVLISCAENLKKSSVRVADDVEIFNNDHYRLAENPELSFLERNIFRNNYKKYENSKNEAEADEGKTDTEGDDASPVKNIHIASLASPADELDYAARTIAKLVREKGYHYTQIAVVSSDVDTYAHYAAKIFKKYEIPYFIDSKTSVNLNPFIELIGAVTEVAADDFSYDSMFRLLKTGFFRYSSDQIDALENYCLAFGIRGKSKWSKEFTKTFSRHGRVKISEERQQRELNRLNDMRQYIFDTVWKVCSCFRDKNTTAGDKTRALYEFIVNLGVQKKLFDRQVEFEAAGEDELASEYKQIYKVVMDLFDKMIDLLGDEVMTAEEYSDVLAAGVEATKIGFIPLQQDCVTLGDIERTRLDNIRVLFFLGVNDGNIPKLKNEGGLLSEYDRELIVQKNIELSPSSADQMFLQKFYLYLNMTKPQDELYITFPRMGADGGALRPSYLVRTLSEMYPELKTEVVEADSQTDIYTVKNAMETYLSELNKSVNDKPSEVFKALYGWFKDKDSFADIMIDTAFFCHNSEKLGAAIAKMIYGATLINSVTRIENYASCSFAHFLQYGLGLGEREEFSIEPTDMGSVFHEIMEQYCKIVDAEYDWKTVTKEEQSVILDRIVKNGLEKLDIDKFTDSNRSEFILQRMKDISLTSIEAVTEQIRGGAFRPYDYEMKITHTDHISVEDVTGLHDFDVQLVGSIDRVDTYEEDGKIYVRIIDYKSGKKELDLVQIYYGHQLQLVMYMDSAIRQISEKHPDKEVVPAGIFYFKIQDPMIETTSDDEGEIMGQILDEMILKGLISDDPVAYQNMDHGIQKKSHLVKLTLNKDGSPSASSGAVSNENMNLMMDYVQGKVREEATEMMTGQADSMPYKLGNYTGCDYCQYRSVCGFNPLLPGFEYKDEAEFDKKEFWSKIAEEEETYECC